MPLAVQVTKLTGNNMMVLFGGDVISGKFDTPICSDRLTV